MDIKLDNGLGYGIPKEGAGYKLYYNWRGYADEIDIDASNVDVQTYEYEDVGDQGETITLEAEKYSVKDKGVMLASLNASFGAFAKSPDYITWCKQNYNMPDCESYADQTALEKAYPDLVKMNDEELYKDEAAKEAAFPTLYNKKIVHTIDGQVLFE